MYRPDTIVNVERITVGFHRWCIVTVKEDSESYWNDLIPKDAFNEDEEFNMCVCVIDYCGDCI